MNRYIKINFNHNKKVKIFLIILIFIQLFYIANKKVNFEFNTFINSFKPNFGAKYIFSEDVLELKLIIEKEKFTFFNISENLKKNTYFYQRSVEFFYPVRINLSSSKIFFSINERLPERCSIIKKYNNFLLAQC